MRDAAREPADRFHLLRLAVLLLELPQRQRRTRGFGFGAPQRERAAHGGGEPEQAVLDDVVHRAGEDVLGGRLLIE